MLNFVSVFLICFILIHLNPFPRTLLAKEAFWHTYPQPPKVKPDNPLNIAPEIEVPLSPEKFRWEIIKSDRGEPMVYTMEYGEKTTLVGSATVGAEITITDFSLSAGRIFYVIPTELVALNNNKTGAQQAPDKKSSRRYWLPGSFLKATAQK